LRRQQVIIYGKQKALIAAGFTRWGTQYRLAKAVEDSKQALLNLAFEEESGFQLQAIVIDHNFWVQLSELLSLLEPLHKAQKMSKDNKSTLAYVFERWNQIQTHLSKFANRGSSFAYDL
jgi:hypothetical protein